MDGLTTFKKNPFELKLSNKESEKNNAEEEKLTRFIKAHVFINNKDQIDLEKCFNYFMHDTELVEDILDLLPNSEKTKFAEMLLHSKEYSGMYKYAKSKVLKICKDYIKHKEFVKLCIESGETQDIQISDEDLWNYYIENDGHIPLELHEKISQYISNLDFDQIVEVLEQKKDKFNILDISNSMNKEYYKKILEIKTIPKATRDKIFRSSIKHLSDDEKIILYQKLSEEEQKELYHVFIIYSIENIDTIEMLINNTKDEILKKLMEFNYTSKPISLDEIIEDLNHCKEYGFEIDFSKIKSFSDSEIAEIYEKIEDEDIKEKLLNLNRKIGTLFGKPSDMTDEEIEEYNNSVPNSILVNQKTIKKYFSTAKSVICYKALIYTEEFENFSFFEKFQVLKDLITKKDTLIENKHYSVSELQNIIIEKIERKASFKEMYYLFENGFITKNTFLDSLHYIHNYKFDISNIFEELKFMESIKDSEIKIKFLKTLNENCTDRVSFYEDKSKRTKIEQENKKNYAILNKTYKEKIADKNVSIENKYLYLSQLLYNYITNEMRKEDKNLTAKLAAEIIELFSKINKEAKKEDYNYIFDFEPKYEKSDLLGEVFGNRYYNLVQCIPYLASDKVYILLKKLYENNHEITKTINARLLDVKLLSTIDYDIIEYISRYGEHFDSVRENNEISSQKLEAFCITYNKLKKIKSYPEEYSVHLMEIIKSINDEELKKIDFSEESNVDILMFLAIHKTSVEDLRKMKSNDEKNIFEIYKEKIKEDAREEIHSKSMNRRKALNAIGKRFFNYSYNRMLELKEKYGLDYKIYLERLNKKAKIQELSLDEENQLKALLTFRNIYELLEIKDINALIRVFDELDQEEEFKECDFLALTTLDEEMKKIYSRDLIEKSYSPSEKDKIDQIDGIDIYSPKKFNMFVHVVGAFGNYQLVDNNMSSKDIWNSPNNKTNHLLCTSYIGNRSLCYVREDFETSTDKKEEEYVILGFGKKTDGYITMASQGDIGSATTSISSEESYALSQYRTAENIMRYCRHGHNEIDFERRILDDKEKNIEPEFVVCFDRINEYSKKVATDFGIPIVFINKREVAQEQNSELKDKIQAFKETKNPDLLGEIINIYQCARISFLVGNDELSIADEFFNATEMNNLITEIMGIIEKERSFGNRKNADNCYLALFKALDDEMKLCKEFFKDIDSLSNYKSNLRETRYKLMQIIKQNNIKPQNTEEYNDVEDTMYKTILTERGKEDEAR